MSEQYGDALAIEVSKRIGRFFAAEADLEDIATQDRDEARLFLALAERTLWIWDPDSSAGASAYVIVPTDNPATGRLVRSDAASAATIAGLSADVSGLTCLSGDAVGNAVYISAASTVAKADADDTTKIPAIGVIVSKQSSTSCTVRVSGLVTGLSGFTAGAIQYLSTTAGALTETAPTAPNAVPVAIAVSTTSILVLGTAGPTFMLLRAKGLLNATKEVPLKIGDWRIVNATGDVGNIAAIGGVMASNSDPILLGEATTNSWAISWAANSVVPIGISAIVPDDLDDTANVTLVLSVSSGSTDAATMAVASSWDGGSEVTDSADDSGTKSATRHLITATIAAADVPASASHVTLRITPPAHTTNGILMFAAKLRYTPKAA